MGAVSALILEAYFPPTKQSLTVLWASLTIAFLVLVTSARPEVQQRLRLIRLRPQKYGPLIVQQILGLHEILARDEGGGRWLVRMSPSDNIRPTIDVDQRILAIGKTAKLMNSGHTELVECRVRTLTPEPQGDNCPSA